MVERVLARSRRGGGHVGDPPVPGVDLAGDQPLLLERSDDLGQRGRTDGFRRRQLAQRHRPQPLQGGEGGCLRGRKVTPALVAQPPAEPHDGQAQSAGEDGVDVRREGH